MRLKLVVLVTGLAAVIGVGMAPYALARAHMGAPALPAPLPVSSAPAVAEHAASPAVAAPALPEPPPGLLPELPALPTLPVPPVPPVPDLGLPPVPAPPVPDVPAVPLPPVVVPELPSLPDLVPGLPSDLLGLRFR